MSFSIRSSIHLNSRALAMLAALCLSIACPGPTTTGDSANSATAVSPSTTYPLVIRGGTIYDGSGQPGFVGDVALDGERIVAVGPGPLRGEREIDARGLAVAPGFINMLSWATESLIHDGRALSDIRQGVTLEVMGEGSSWGPLNDEMKRAMTARQGDIRLSHRMDDSRPVHGIPGAPRGVAQHRVVCGRHHRAYPRIGSSRPPAPTRRNCSACASWFGKPCSKARSGSARRSSMRPRSLPRPMNWWPCGEIAGEYDGMYITHMRSEANRLLEAIDEVIDIARRANIKAEIYHLKAAGKDNWSKLDQAIARIEDARRSGLRISADMYTYPAAATGLDAAMPPWVQEGGHDAWVARLRDPAVRARVKREMTTPNDAWENFYLLAGSPDRIILAGFDNPALKPLIGKTLADVAKERNQSPEDTAMDLVIEDNSRVGTVYFVMSEDNVAKKVAQPWMSFGSDADAPATEGVFLKSGRHPRTYGTFARLLGRYVREQKIISLAEAVRRLTSLPAGNLGLRERGRITPGFFADVVVFSAERITDHATFAKPHQYSTGVEQVFVNGRQVLADGEHTGAKPGRFIRGPGWNAGVDSAAAQSLDPTSSPSSASKSN